jgi:hypothetical protein
VHPEGVLNSMSAFECCFARSGDGEKRNDMTVWWEPWDGSKLAGVVASIIRYAGAASDRDDEGVSTLEKEMLAEIRVDEEERRARSPKLMRVVSVEGDGSALPPDLEEVYRELSSRALVQPGAAYVGDPIEKAKGRMVTRVSTGQTETRGGAKGSRKSGGSKDFIRSERAFNEKARIDRKLRKIAREIRAWLRDSAESRDDVRRCTTCRKFGEPEWLYCPKDGKPMESV